DLKLYRVPEPVTVAAKSLKQVAFLDQEGVEGRLLYTARCTPWDAGPEALPAGMLLATVNDKQHGLGMALPMGGVTVFEPTSFGEDLAAQERVRDHAEGQRVNVGRGPSTQVVAHGGGLGGAGPAAPAPRAEMRLTLSNANRTAARVRIVLGPAGGGQIRGLPNTRVKDGEVIVDVAIPGNGRREITWTAGDADGA